MRGNESINIGILLSHVPLFSGLGPEEIARIAAGTTEVQAHKGDILVRKGDICDGFHLIVKGQVKLVFASAEGNEKVVDILGQDQTFGEALMFGDQPYVVFAQALSDSILLRFSKAVIFEEFDRDPVLRLKMLSGMTRHLGRLMADVGSYSVQSGKQRVVSYLLRQLPAIPRAKDALVVLPASKGNIASRLNLTQEHFSRILHELSEQGLIVVQGSRILIPDLQQLRNQQH